MRHRNLAEKNRDRKPVESGRISIKAHPEVRPARTFTRRVGAKRVVARFFAARLNYILYRRLLHAHQFLAFSILMR